MHLGGGSALSAGPPWGTERRAAPCAIVPVVLLHGHTPFGTQIERDRHPQFRASVSPTRDAMLLWAGDVQGARPAVPLRVGLDPAQIPDPLLELVLVRQVAEILH